MEKFILQAKIRRAEVTAASLRKLGFIPVELYGHKVDNVHLVVNRSELERVYKQAGATSIVEIQIEGEGARVVLVHDLQRNYLTEDLDHADFYQVNLSEKIHANVPLKIIGESKAVKEMAGVLVELVREVEVEALPQDLPHELSVDISKLASFDDMVLALDIVVPAGVVLLTPPDEQIVKVQPPRDLEKDLAVPTETVSAADVEVEKKGKKEEEKKVE